MLGLGMGEILLLVGIVLLLFGAKKLPGLGAAFGKSITNFKKGLKGDDDNDDDQDKNLPG
jgi:sec-independent protein translocase protein TatA